MPGPLGRDVRIQPTDFTVGTETYEGRLNVPGEDTETGVVVLPGAGHGPFGDVFDVISYELAGDGKHVVRYDSWENHEQLAQKTFGELHDEINAAIDHLRSEGCRTFYLLAKSFGGGLALTHVPEAIERVVLWEPAIEITDEAESTPETKVPTPPDNLTITEDELGRIGVPVRILCGDEEAGVPVDVCEQIANALGQGEMTVIPGENHSFNSNRPAIVEATVEFFP